MGFAFLLLFHHFCCLFLVFPFAQHGFDIKLPASQNIHTNGGQSKKSLALELYFFYTYFAFPRQQQHQKSSEKYIKHIKLNLHKNVNSCEALTQDVPMRGIFGLARRCWGLYPMSTCKSPLLCKLFTAQFSCLGTQRKYMQGEIKEWVV
jgi:hypothetical protein